MRHEGRRRRKRLDFVAGGVVVWLIRIVAGSLRWARALRAFSPAEMGHHVLSLVPVALLVTGSRRPRVAAAASLCRRFRRKRPGVAWRGLDENGYHRRYVLPPTPAGDVRRRQLRV
ncbi:hypothetical protein GUJ93_ZPchr0010g7512 [Zizania palustris]|uniref:Uncharacterized protein n=1 Tax=Zizania palustris TaxID=103762 RepID=A0A8J6BH07_ZIZPA|nr:hypothetical protein GUJ93_ZPchr0010g7512 [Zizania palustris]